MVQNAGVLSRVTYRKLRHFITAAYGKFFESFGRTKSPTKTYLNSENIKNIGTVIKQRRFSWLGHVLRMPNERPPKVALS